MEGRMRMGSGAWRRFLGNAFLSEAKGKGASATGLPDGVSVPTHLAIIMDGNGRWARRRGLPRQAGHRRGAENLRRIVDVCGHYGVKYMTVYAFSTENWSRPGDEVAALMDLFLEFLERFDEEMEKVGIRLRYTGDLEALPDAVRAAVERSEKRSRDRTNMQLILALNYGGRREIVHAASMIAKDVAMGKLDAASIDEETFSSRLYLPDVPDPDLVIRPSGERRISNFLLWESAYSEFWFSDVLWPDFSEKDLIEAFRSYTARERRFGGVK